MRIYIAALSNVTTGRLGAHGRIINIAEPSWMLESYHYMNDIKVAEAREKKRKLFLDSGAFSMFTQGVELDLKAYARYLHKNKDIIEVAASQDIIGEGREQENYNRLKELEAEGCDVLPVHHVRDNDYWLERYIAEGYEFICLGGMVPETTPLLFDWLSKIWDKYLTDADGYRKVKVHGFGLTTLSLMFEFPWWSVDSTAWIMISRFGGVMMDMPTGRDWKVDFSSRSSKQLDIDSWHYKSLTDKEHQERAAIDQRLVTMEAARIKHPELEEELSDVLGYDQGYNPISFAESYGWRGHATIHYFERIQARGIDRYKRKQKRLEL